MFGLTDAAIAPFRPLPGFLRSPMNPDAWRLTWIVFVMLCQIAITDVLYYLRTVQANQFVQSDVVVIGIPIVAAFALQATVIGVRGRTRAGRFLFAGSLSALGFLVSMFIALNAWGS